MTNRTQIPLTPLGDRLAVILDPKVAQSIGGIVIPDRAQEVPSWGTVVSHGPEAQHCIAGDRVYVPTHLGTSYLAGDANLVIINEAKVLAREERTYKLATGDNRTETEIDSDKVVPFEPRKPWADTVPKGLCEGCKHRAESIDRVKKWQERGSHGMVCDPAPKVECKDHDGYGREGSRTYCDDFTPATVSHDIVGCSACGKNHTIDFGPVSDEEKAEGFITKGVCEETKVEVFVQKND